MKIYNLGNDYAHQQKLKIKTESIAAEVSESPKTETSESNAGNQIQGGGKRELASAPELSDTSKKTKKKKEDGAEKEQQKDLPEI